MTTLRVRAAAALLSTAMLLAACGGGDTTTEPGASSDSAQAGAEGGGGEPVTLTWWHNSSAEPGLTFFADVAKEFEEANPNVTIEPVPTQNEELRTKIQIALQSDPPDLFQQWGGGEMGDQVEAGKLMDISDPAADTIEALGGSVAGWQYDGKTYGLPYTLGVVGFWYNQALFEQAGISETPTTMEELFAAVDALKAADITPIAVGAGDKWPAAFYYYYSAVRTCTPEALEAAGSDSDFSDPCFVQAAEEVAEIVDQEPFQEGYLAAPAQQGASSAAGLMANGNAAMELMGHWDPAVMEGLTDEDPVLGGDLGWFGFPAIDGASADPAAMLGGGDGYSCSAEAPPECVEFLTYLVSPDVQTRFAEVTGQLPVADEASSAITDPNMETLLEVRQSAPYIQLYLDVAYGPNVGGALNDELALLFAEQAEPQAIVDAMQAAADTQ